jgi:N-acetylneuraminate synthase
MRCQIIAEIGSTHDGSFGNAKCLVDAASECGVDAVKFQTHISEAETLRDAPMPPYFRGEPRFEYFKRTAFSKTQWKELKDYAEDKGLLFLSSPFSVEAVDLLEEIGIVQYKIPSGEVTNLPYLDYIARTGKPVLLSSGMSSWAELDEAVGTILRHHNNLTVLQCTTEYPCAYENVGLNVMLEMRTRYGRPVGFSDHTLANHAIFAAVTLGASVVEKHFTLSRRMYGSDARHSAEPEQMKDLVSGVRAIETMLETKASKEQVEKFRLFKDIFEKSVVSLTKIPEGTIIEKGMIGIKKPGTGIPAKRFFEVVGRKARRTIPADSLLKEEDLF